MVFQLVAKRVRANDHTDTILITLMQAKEMCQEDRLIVVHRVGKELIGLPIILSTNLKLLCLEANPLSTNGNSK